MLDRLLTLLQIRRHEMPSALLLTGFFFLAMASVSVVKSIQNALYLSRLGFDWRLPMLYLVLGLGSGVIVVLNRSRRISLRKILGTLLFLVLGFLVFLALLRSESLWVPAVFYLWSGFFAVLVPTQGWLLSYEIYTTREAKRIFSLLGTGGILGGAAGGYYASFVAHWLSAEAIIGQVVVALLLLMLLLVEVSRRAAKGTYAPVEGRKEKSGATGLRVLTDVFNQSYLRSLGGMVLLTSCVSTVIDLKYKASLESQFGGSAEQITEFFGTLLGSIFILSALLQLGFTNAIIRRLGVGFSLLILPLALFFGSFPLMIVGTLWAIAGLKMVEGSLRSSVHRTVTELLYIPLGRQRTSAKGVIDLMVFRLGDALGASLILVSAGLTMGPIGVNLMLLIVSAVLILASVSTNREYARLLRQTLEKRLSDGGRRKERMDEPGEVRPLLAALSSDRPGKIHFALRELARFEEEGKSLAVDLDASVELVYPQMVSRQEPDWLVRVIPLLDHPNREVAAAALHLLTFYRPAYWEKVSEACGFGSIPDDLCLYYLRRYVKELSQTSLNPKTLLAWSESANREQAVILAELMARLPDDSFLPKLREWSRSAERRCARASLIALGAHRNVEDLSLLVDHLGLNWSVTAARQAFRTFGPTALPVLRNALQSGQTPITIKREIPLLLVEIDGASVQEDLVRSLYLDDPQVSFRALKALNRLRRTKRLNLGELTFTPVLQNWAREYYQLINLDLAVGKPLTPEQRLLKKAVRERLAWGIEKIFRGLELFLPAGDAYYSYLGFTGDELSLRENAIELVDARIKGELRPTLLPIFSAHSEKEAVEAGRRIFGLPIHPDAVLADALFSADTTLKCCILSVARASSSQILRNGAARACHDINPLVRETAAWALGRGPDVPVGDSRFSP